MTAVLKPVRGSVRIICCERCGATIPTFDFEGETDTDTIGLCSAGLCNDLDIVLAELDLLEWRRVISGQEDKLPSRFEDEIGGKNYRIVHILRVAVAETPAAGLSFSEFRKQYVSPTVIYSCPCCGIGQSISQSEMTVADFREAGGQVTTLGNLTLIS